MFHFAHRNKRLLDGLSKTQKWGNAYLFYGNTGCFLNQAAQYLTLLLLCEHTEKPCLICNSCRQVISQNSIHVRWVTPEEKWGIEMIRDLQTYVQYGASDKHLVIIIPHCDKLSTEATNAFLKTLEEPENGVRFILLTYHPQALLPTLKSRCQLLDFSQGDTQAELESLAPEAQAHLKEHTYNQKEFIQYALEHTVIPEITFRTLKDVLASSLTNRIAYAQTLTQNKESIPLILMAWLRESLSHTEPHRFEIQNLLIASLIDMKYNINARLRLEGFFLSLPELT